MFQPRLRKVALKRALDATLYRGVARGAAAVVVASERERDDVVACGVPAEKVRVRGNGFPEPDEIAGERRPAHAARHPRGGAARALRRADRVRQGHRAPARRRAGAAARRTSSSPGPDDRHGVVDAGGERVHTLPMTEEPPRALYPQADVFVLASAGESFGMVAAEAAAAGTPVIVSDRCGIAGFFEDGEALVVPYEREAVVERDPAACSRTTQLRERLTQRRPGRRAADVLGSRDRRAGGDLPRGRLAHGGDEALDRRLVAPGAHELARTLAHPPAQLGVAGELAQGVGSRGDVVGRDEEAVLAVAEQVVRRADAIGEHERQAGRRRLVDDDAPRLVPREQREHVGVDVALCKLVLARRRR